MEEDVVVAIQCQPFGPVLQRQVIDEIERLRKRDAILSALEAGGVDNGEWYSESLREAGLW